MNEIELAANVIEWLNNREWDVFQEVQFRAMGSIADIVAVKNDRLWIIECKTTLTLAVMEQAQGWSSDFRSIAVKRNYRRKTKGRFLAERICRHYLHIGLLAVGDRPNQVDEDIKAPWMNLNQKSSKAMMQKLKAEHKQFSKAGSSAGGHFTPYKGTMIKVHLFIAEHSGCTIADIVNALGKLHYADRNSAKSNLRNALELNENWCRVECSYRPARCYLKSQAQVIHAD